MGRRPARHKKHLRQNEGGPSRSRFRAVPGIELLVYGNQSILVHHSSCYTLSGVAPRIWALLERGASPRTIVSLLHQEVGAPTGQLASETTATVHRLLSAGLLERHPA